MFREQRYHRAHRLRERIGKGVSLFPDKETEAHSITQSAHRGDRRARLRRLQTSFQVPVEIRKNQQILRSSFRCRGIFDRRGRHYGSGVLFPEVFRHGLVERGIWRHATWLQVGRRYAIISIALRTGTLGLRNLLVVDQCTTDLHFLGGVERRYGNVAPRLSSLPGGCLLCQCGYVGMR